MLGSNEVRPSVRAEREGVRPKWSRTVRPSIATIACALDVADSRWTWGVSTSAPFLVGGVPGDPEVQGRLGGRCPGDPRRGFAAESGPGTGPGPERGRAGVPGKTLPGVPRVGEEEGRARPDGAGVRPGRSPDVRPLGGGARPRERGGDAAERGAAP